MDYFDADGYAAMFTQDSILDWARGEVKGRAGMPRTFIGQQNLRPAKIELRASTNSGWQGVAIDGASPWSPTRVIGINGDTARAVSSWMNYGNNADRRKSSG